MEGDGHERHSTGMAFVPSPSARTDDPVHRVTAILIADEACPWDRSLPSSLLPPHLPWQHVLRGSDRSPKGRDRRSRARPTRRHAALARARCPRSGQPPSSRRSPPFRPASFPKNVTNPLFRVALLRHSGTLAPLPEKARRWGVVTPSGLARSQFHWGRVACAHVQPATVKAHAPVPDRLLTSGFGRRPEWT
jgi:hypothetical protein